MQPLVWLTICDTCNFDKAKPQHNGQSDGRRMGALIEESLSDNKAAKDIVRVRYHSCMMACSNACTISVQSPGKISYILGRFAAERENAAAIVAYARFYIESKTGQVPYRLWPEAIKGHFISRYFPLP